MMSFNNNHTNVLSNMAAVVGTSESTTYVNNVQTAIDNAVDALKKESLHRKNVDVNYLKGWLAEQWHSETLKVSAAARGRSDVFSKVNGANVPGEDINYGTANATRTAEVKYYKTAEDTAKAVSRPEYNDNSKIVPSDQLEAIKSEAARLALKNKDNRPEQAKAYEDTASNADDRLRVGNATSKPLSEKESLELAKDSKEGNINPDKYNLNTENFVEWSDVARQSGEAALHAAAMSAAIVAAPYIWRTINDFLETGKIDIKSLSDAGGDTFLAASNAGLRSSVAAGITASCKAGLMGDTMKSISPAAIGIATTMTFNTIVYSIQLQQGKITKKEFANQCIRDSFVLTSTFSGAALGQTLIPIPLLGALVGNLVGSTLGAVVYQGTSQLVLGVCVESGWTMFGIVKQGYVISDDVLRRCGYDLFCTQSFRNQSFTTSSFQTSTFTKNSLSFQPIRRGIISCNVVAYI